LRLDQFLGRPELGQQLGREPRLSRSRAQHLIAKGLVLVNGRPVRSSQRLQPGDLIAITVPAPEKIDLEPEAIPLDIVYEDADLLVVNKPSGLVVHPAAGNARGTLVNALLQHCPDLPGIGGCLRPGIVHRLDKDTSGLLLVSKTDLAHSGLAAQLKERRIKRSYLALVHGEVRCERGTIDAPLGRDPRDRKRMAVVSGGRQARTHYRVRERFPGADLNAGDQGYTLLEVELETGRTHQIRVHLAYIGHPVAGDPVYGRRRLRAGRQPHLNLTGQALHAYRIAFAHPRTGEALAFEAPLPPAFSAALDLLRSSQAPV
jgi:23S rRNA pseudouridine1911/1915/1917 synthase